MSSKRIEKKVKEYREKMETLEQRDKDKKERRDKFNSMSLVERNAYEEIIERRTNGSWLNMAVIPIRIFIYIGLFGLILQYFYLDGLVGFGDIILYLKIMGLNILGLLKWTLPIAIIGWILEMIYIRKLKRKLLT